MQKERNRVGLEPLQQALHRSWVTPAPPCLVLCSAASLTSLCVMEWGYELWSLQKLETRPGAAQHVENVMCHFVGTWNLGTCCLGHEFPPCVHWMQHHVLWWHFIHWVRSHIFSSVKICVSFQYNVLTLRELSHINTVLCICSSINE